MEAFKETTVWKEGQVPNHTYLLDKGHLVAYIKQGDTAPFFFKNVIKNFDRRGRTFVKADSGLFGTAKKTTLREVAGSKGAVYMGDDEAKTCTCPGYIFRGQCKHIG